MSNLRSNKKRISIKRRIVCIWGIVVAVCLVGCQDKAEEERTEQTEAGVTPSQEVMSDTGSKKEAEPVSGGEEAESVTNSETDFDEWKKAAMEEFENREYPDVPEVFWKVLRQYEQLIGFTVDQDWDSSWDELYCGDWKYVDVYLYGDGRDSNIYYSLYDLTGDGFPEMIMGKKSVYHETWYAYLIYYYDGEDVRLDCHGGGRYLLTFYTNGYVELLDSLFIAYYQFEEEDQEWRRIIKIDYERNKDGEFEYLKNDTDAKNPDPSLFEEISEEEYRQIIEQYTATPIELEWTMLWEIVG